MKKFILYCFFCTGFIAFSQNDTKTIAEKLKMHPQQDTTRCYLLNQLIEEEQDNAIWIKYNGELKEIALNHIKKENTTDAFYKTYLKYLSIAFNNDGAYAIYKDQYKLAIKNYRKSYQLTSKINFHEGSSLALQNIGTAYDFIGKLDSSLFYFKKAHLEAVLSKNQSSIAYVLTDLGFVYNNLGNNSLAIKYNLQALKIFEALQDDIGKERTTFSIGRIFDSQKDYEKSLPYYRKCLQINTIIQDEQRQVLLLNSMANVYINLKKEELATEYLEKAIALGKKTNNQSGLASSYKFYGDIYFEKNNTDKANAYYLEAARIYKSIESHNFYAKVLIQLAKINLQKKNLALAKEQALIGLKIGKESSFPSEYKNAAEIISQIYGLEKNYKKAYEFKTIAVNIGDSIYFDETRDIALKATFKYETDKKEASIKELTQQKKITQLQSDRKSFLIYSIIGGILAFGLLLYFMFNRYKTNKQNELLKVELQEAEKTIQAEKKASESELKALKSQMNPHFIFNALNGIQEQFMYGDKMIANEQMGNFTYLTRQILNVSGKKQIPISTEIEILTKYLELEKMRFSKDFEYQIIFTDAIDEDYLQIPPMLIQPFVENSIKHGLLHKEGQKKISIAFDLDEKEEYILCTIEDNGIGRQKSAEIKAKNESNHASFSTESIEQRLELLNQNGEIKDLIQFEDLTDTDSNNTGTRVTIKIPMS